jgi:hypothetical protein
LVERRNYSKRNSRKYQSSYAKSRHTIGEDDIFPALGPLPLRDVDGMGAAALQLLKMLDPGVNQPLVQYKTAKHMTTALGALWEVSLHSKEETEMVRDMLES